MMKLHNISSFIYMIVHVYAPIQIYTATTIACSIAHTTQQHKSENNKKQKNDEHNLGWCAKICHIIIIGHKINVHLCP